MPRESPRHTTSTPHPPRPLAVAQQDREKLLASYHHYCVLYGASICHTALQRVYAAIDVYEQTGLCSLDLSHLYFGPGTARGSSDGFHAFSAALAETLTLPVDSVVLTGTLIGDDGLLAFSQALSHAPAHSGGGVTRLSALHLSGCGLCHVQYALPALLAACPLLHTLDLSWNRIGCAEDSLSATTVAVAQHRALASVNLAQNLLGGGPCVRALAEMLVIAAARPRSCAALTSVDLRDNQLGVNDDAPTTTSTSSVPLLSSQPLIDALLLNNDITSLAVSGNALSPSVLAWLEAKLEVNKRAKRRVCGEVAQRVVCAANSSDVPLSAHDTPQETARTYQSLTHLRAYFLRSVDAHHRGGDTTGSVDTHPTVSRTSSKGWQTEEVLKLVTDIFDAVRDAIV